MRTLIIHGVSIGKLFDVGCNMQFFSRLVSICFFSYSIMQAAGITNQIGGGRLGDQLHGYIRAKYVAHTLKIPFYLTPFDYAEKFLLFNKEKRIPQDARCVKVDNENNIDPLTAIVYDMSYLMTYSKLSDSFYIFGWQALRSDQMFMEEIRECLTPKDSADRNLEIPADCVSVAIHIRQMSGKDVTDGNVLFSKQLYTTSSLDLVRGTPAQKFYQQYLLDRKQGICKTSYIDIPFWFKFPPLQYYIDQLKIVLDLEKENKVWICIFTDGNPFELCKIIREHVRSDDVIIYAPIDTATDNSIARDLYVMSKFDYFIRSESNFAQMSHLIGKKFKKVFYPKSAVWVDGCMVIDSVGIDGCETV